LGSNRHTIFCKHDISGEGCNCKFSKNNLGVWCVIKFRHPSMHLHLTYNPYQLWGLSIDGIWILLAHWVCFSNNLKTSKKWNIQGSWSGTIVLTNKSHKGCMFQMLQSQTMACNNSQGLEVLCALKTTKGDNERILKTSPLYIIF
jgi:hypothetical protein